jgi:hypothetical protein
MADPGSATERVLSYLEPLGHVAGPLAQVVSALVAPLEQEWALGEYPGAAVALDPDTVDPSWLPLLAEAVGGRLLGGFTIAQQRAEVKAPAGWARGRPQHKTDVSTPHLHGQMRVTVRQRYDGSGEDAPGHIQIRVRAIDVIPGHEEALRRDLEAAIPAHLLGDIRITNDRDYDEGRTRTPSYDAARELNADYDDALDGA